MRARIAVSGLAVAWFASVAFGQTASGSGVDRTFQLAGGESPQAMQEIVNIVRSVTAITQIVTDFHAAITASGTPEQIVTAAWLIGQLDRPDKSANLTYMPPGLVERADDGAKLPAVVRIFYLAHAANPQQVQEMINSIRSITYLQRTTAYNPSSAVILRGTQAKIALAEWIVKGLDIAPGKTPAPAETPVTFVPGEVAQIFYLTNGQTAQQTQEIVNTIRTLGDIQRITANNQLPAIVLRATGAQAAVATWLVGELDKPAPGTQAVDSYVMQEAADGVLRVFYLPDIQSPDVMQQLVNQIRGAASIHRIGWYISAKAVAMRGTADQIAIAEQMIQRAKI